MTGRKQTETLGVYDNGRSDIQSTAGNNLTEPAVTIRKRADNSLKTDEAFWGRGALPVFTSHHPN